MAVVALHIFIMVISEGRRRWSKRTYIASFAKPLGSQQMRPTLRTLFVCPPLVYLFTFYFYFCFTASWNQALLCVNGFNFTLLFKMYDH